MQLFNQKKLPNAWKLGKSGVDANDYACNALSVASLASYFNPFKMIYSSDFILSDLYSPEGMLDYDRLNEFLKKNGYGFEYVGSTSDLATAAKFADPKNPNAAVIVMVKIKGVFTHFMVGVSYSPIVGWRVADTLTGTIRLLSLCGYGKAVSYRLYKRLK